MHMYVNKRVELAQRGIVLQKMYVLFILFIIKDLTCMHRKQLREGLPTRGV